MIREATIKDLDVLVKHAKGMHEESENIKYGYRYNEADTRNTLTNIIENDSCIKLVLEKKGRVVGSITGVLVPWFTDASMIISKEIYWYVERQHRGQGILLLRKYEQESKERGAASAVAAGASIVGGLIGKSGAEKAAKTQTSAGDRAAQMQLQAQREAIEAQERALDRQIKLYEPFRKIGIQALLRQQRQILMNKEPTFRQFFYSPEAKEIRRQELEDIATATERTAAARGRVFSPATQLELQKKALQQTSASKMGQFQNVIARRERQMNRLTDLINIGRGAATGAAQASGQAGGNISNIIQSGGQTQAGLMQSAGQARASGIIGGTQSLMGATGNITSNILLNQLLKDQTTPQTVRQPNPFASTGGGAQTGISGFGTPPDIGVGGFSADG
jgi:hypothetical protein